MADYMDAIEEQRRTFRDDFRRNSSDKDRIVVAVSSATLGLSIAFASNIEPNAGWKWLLVLAWSAFGASVVLVLLSLHVNSGQISRSIEYIDKWKEIRDGDRPKDGAYMVKVGKWEIRIADALNTLSVFSLIAGIILIVVFVSSNL